MYRDKVSGLVQNITIGHCVAAVESELISVRSRWASWAARSRQAL